jgi:MFS family permease
MRSPIQADSQKDKSTFQAFRPRLLFCPLFAWNAITGGKFISTLLQYLSPNFSEGVIGLTLSIQYVVVVLLAGWGGRLADMEEKQSTFWGWGRLKVMCWGILIGTIAFVGHGLPNLLKYGIITNPDDDSIMMFPWHLELGWHISMRILWAVAFVLTAPAMDGLALAHLSAIDGSSQQDFGVERMYGAVWWGGGSLIAGIGIDYFGFEFLYALAIVLGIFVYVAVGLYLWSVNRDTSGSFDEAEDDFITDTNIQSTSETIKTKDMFVAICSSFYGLSLVFFVFTFAIGLSVVDNLAFLFFNWLGSSNSMDGWTVVFTVILELPLFYLSPSLLKRFGPGKLLLIAGSAYVTRVVGYALVPQGNLWMILILEMLHGISYACSKTGSVEYIARVTPDGHEASGQGLLFTIRFFGVVVGLFFGGLTQQTFGGRILYLGMGVLVFIGMIVLSIAEACKSDQESSENDESNHLLVKSDSACSSSSAFADVSTERWCKNLKYDSLNKYVKDW